ncbi:MAG: hypothetical protein ABGW87_14410 [Sphingomonadaceae bacterium]
MVTAALDFPSVVTTSIFNFTLSGTGALWLTGDIRLALRHIA